HNSRLSAAAYAWRLGRASLAPELGLLPLARANSQRLNGLASHLPALGPPLSTILELAQCRLYLMRAQRLEQERAEQNCLRRARYIPRDEHDLEVGPYHLRDLRQLDAVSVRHHDIGEKHVDVLLRDDGQRIAGIFGGYDAEALAF